METRPLELPPHAEMVRAYIARDVSYEGVFFTAVKTTGVFCRPGCPARLPKPANVEFFRSANDALLAGYRPCRRCHPMDPVTEVPHWAASLLRHMERDPARVWRAKDLRAVGLHPATVARWFKRHYKVTFHALSRATRLGHALKAIQNGDSVTRAAYDAGYDSLAGFNHAFRQFADHAPSRSAATCVVNVQRFQTALGPMVAAATATHLVLLEFADRRMLPTQFGRLIRHLRCVFVPGPSDILNLTQHELAEYFDGSRITFSAPVGLYGTRFQRDVWSTLQTIPLGERWTYAGVAAKIGQPTAVRAVARANGDNRVAILIPCHRVVAADGTLAGYGGGLWRKQRLLDLEVRHAALDTGTRRTSSP